MHASYYIFHGNGGRAVLDLTLIFFSRSELLCRRFAPLSHSKILFHKITIQSNNAFFKPALYLTGAEVSFFYSQRHYVPPITLFWKFSSRIGLISFDDILHNLCQVDLFDQVPLSEIAIVDKPETLAFEVVAERVEWAVNNETLTPEDFRTFLASLKL